MFCCKSWDTFQRFSCLHSMYTCSNIVLVTLLKLDVTIAPIFLKWKMMYLLNWAPIVWKENAPGKKLKKLKLKPENIKDVSLSQELYGSLNHGRPSFSNPGYSFMLRSPNQRANQIHRSYKNEEFDWLFDFVTVTWKNNPNPWTKLGVPVLTKIGPQRVRALPAFLALNCFYYVIVRVARY